jgi:hypothetical protein
MKLRDRFYKEKRYFNKTVQVQIHVLLLHSDESSRGRTEDETLLTDWQHYFADPWLHWIHPIYVRFDKMHASIFMSTWWKTNISF